MGLVNYMGRKSWSMKSTLLGFAPGGSLAILVRGLRSLNLLGYSNDIVGGGAICWPQNKANEGRPSSYVFLDLVEVRSFGCRWKEALIFRLGDTSHLALDQGWRSGVGGQVSTGFSDGDVTDVVSVGDSNSVFTCNLGLGGVWVVGPACYNGGRVSDLGDVERCSFEGYQDTLYAHSLRQFYKECDIYGTVDFIFGNAAAVFQSCNLYARKPMPNQKNAFTAQGRTDPNQNTGISIHNCTIEAAPDLAMDLNSTLNFWEGLGSSVGWLEWNGTVGLDTLYYGEFENHGPGANTSRRVQWPGYSLMNATQALNFTVLNFTLGDTWLPYTDIPFFAGLIEN
uniref:probable pectinesterase/pectinesterase inhibitor 47 n=1 Tax=Fragaria vesca subsp. vesca TaxID=101020 RepID=UPI0005C9621E|nr:PREDICTED: probable pectinesterase/pectinesterase inhibitor 47 [Fragaria vesca subsp. vesca]